MHKTKTLLLRSTLAIAVIGIFFWFGIQKQVITVDGGFRMTMGTVARIVVTAENQTTASKAIDAAFAGNIKVTLGSISYFEKTIELEFSLPAESLQ